MMRPYTVTGQDHAPSCQRSICARSARVSGLKIFDQRSSDVPQLPPLYQ